MAPKLRSLHGKTIVKILCNHFGFSVSGQRGSHIRLSKKESNKKIGTVIPLHEDIKIGTLKSILKLAKVSITDFEEYL